MQAAEIAGSLIRQLAVPAPAGLPLLVDIAQDLATDPGNTLVHGDLHYGNIRAGIRKPWLALDPKPAIGNQERSVPELMWNRIDDAQDAAAVHDLLRKASNTYSVCNSCTSPPVCRARR
ncbi:hypothetical protein FOE78_05490 [Microlunatus elymi]|uniref:Streptomycin 6-kinase n=1 Tax=Microlunatus elymi TaxID=2596828 RepID=A0A516PWB3_9ACTN|nr:aminoglycoside phosphotransferase family protein [Microlunatus elymi]QDP95432.1 hypothetical protein FOE78_05490 [Microlunatus elymi]